MSTTFVRVEKIMTDEDVQFILSMMRMMSADWADPSAAAFLKMITSKWTKIRAFIYQRMGREV